MSDSAFSDLAPVAYGVVIHKTFGWPLPNEEKTRQFLLGRQHEDGAFFNVAGTTDPKSPPAKLVDVPSSTKKLRFKLIDLDAVGYPHGGDTISYAGKNSFPYGAFHYTGPCPPSPHTYVLSVEALDAGGKTLAKAEARKRFP